MKKTILMFLLVFSSIMNAQTDKIKVSGKVSDNNGMGVPGVTVAFDDKSTVTDLDGKFSLLASSAKTVVTFSYLGFETKKVTVAKSNTLNVTLVEANNQLNEVVVVGYGSMKKDNVTGSVTKFKTDALNDLPVSRVDQALQGKIAGVQVKNTSSEAGSDPTIQIRGVASINANAQPLVVVDGQPIQDGLSSLNMADVLDVTVLKDAASASIYGSRGANGVILVTTKSGGESKTKYAFTYSHGFKSAYKKWDNMSMTDYVHMGLKNDATRTAEGITGLTQASTVRRLSYYIENVLGDGPTDYQDEFLRTGEFKNIQLSASGGSKTIKYYVSGGYNGDQGMFLKSDYTKYNFRSKVSVDLTKKITLNLNINPSYSKTQKPVADYNNFIRFSTWLPKSLNQKTIDYILANSDPSAYNASELKVGSFAHPQYFRNVTNVPAFDYLDGSGTSAAIVGTTTSAWTTGNSNPLYSVLVSDDDKEDFRIQSSLDLNFKITKGLVFKTSVSYYSKFANRLQYLGHRSGSYGSAAISNANSATYTDERFIDLLNENLLTYKTTFNKVHDLELTGLFSANTQRVVKSTSTGILFPDDNIRTLNQMAGSTNITVDGTTNKLGLLSYMGRVNYSYNGKYNLTASTRTDGSSLFLNKKWGVFPAVSVGWNVAKESFIADKLTWIDKLGLRASYGATGNNRIESVSGLSNSYNPGFSTFLVTPGIVGSGSGTVLGGVQIPSVYSNPDLTWETTWQKNLGIDFAFLKNRFNLSVDVYQSKTDDLLLLDSNLPSTGSTYSWLNVGSVENKGIEIELSTTNINNKNFSWSTAANFSSNRN